MSLTLAEMSCRELVELVTEYLEGALSGAERRRFDHHLARCPGCTAYLEQMRSTLLLVGSLREEHLPEHMRARLLEAFLDWKAGAEPR